MFSEGIKPQTGYVLAKVAGAEEPTKVGSVFVASGANTNRVGRGTVIAWGSWPKDHQGYTISRGDEIHFELLDRPFPTIRTEDAGLVTFVPYHAIYASVTK